MDYRKPGKVIISIVTPVYNTDPEVLEECLQSVVNQTYTNWELCICDDGSTREETKEVLTRYRGWDPRIRIVFSNGNAGISVATNIAMEQATGHFLAFLDHDDTLDLRALELIAQTLESDDQIDLLYTDEDKIDFDGSYVEPFYKPDWSPEHLQSVMYVLHFLVVRKSLFLKLEGMREEFSGAQDYDLTLRATEMSRKVAHIPSVLYHWRKVKGSASAEVDAKPYALLNARKALESALGRRKMNANVEDGLLAGTFRVRPAIKGNPLVTLLILTDARTRELPGRGDILLIDNFIDSIIEKSTYKNYQMVVVDNGNLPDAIVSKIKRLGGRVINYSYDPPFNFPKKINFAFEQVKTEHVIILNDDLEVISKDWIEALLEWSQQKEIGAVGARLLFHDDRIQHAGVVLGVNGSAAHVFHGAPVDPPSYYGYSHLIRNYSAVTGAVLATRMELVNKINGFDPSMRIDFNDIDFSLKIRKEGYRIVYTPYAELYHFEGSSESRTTQSDNDLNNFVSRWKEELRCDPFYNPNLPTTI